MHDQLGKTDFWQRHIETLLQDGRPRGGRNERFRGKSRMDSPIRRFARRKFQESVLSMVSGVYLGGGSDSPVEE